MTLPAVEEPQATGAEASRASAAAVQRDTLRIGVYGALANNMYNLAKLLRRTGYDVTYVREPDTYPMSQPMWEDVELTFDPQRLPHDQPSLGEWRDLETQLGWQRPSWVVDAEGVHVARRKKFARAARLAPHLDPRLYSQLRWYNALYAGAIEHLRSCDWVVACGPGVIAAYLSGTPYLYWPFGGDVMIMPQRTGTPVDRFIARGIRTAVRHATAAGSHDPAINETLRELGYRREPGWYQFVVDTDRYRPRDETDVLGPLAEEVRERADGRLVLLMCSRQDFEWKGSDRFLAAFVRAVRKGAPLFLVVTPWGNDLEQAKRLLLDSGLDDSFHVLPGLPSKPLLRQLLWAADVAVDQFALGSFGTAALEAMACGRPVLMHIDDAVFAQRAPAGYPPPPVLQAASEDEIATVLLAIGSGGIDPREAGRVAREWIVEHHGPQHLSKYLPA
jgi:glycosyltransferase involved in cell wall biosynthesis